MRAATIKPLQDKADRRYPNLWEIGHDTELSCSRLLVLGSGNEHLDGSEFIGTRHEKWLRLVGQLRAFLKWCLACAAYAAVSRAGRLLKYT